MQLSLVQDDWGHCASSQNGMAAPVPEVAASPSSGRLIALRRPAAANQVPSGKLSLRDIGPHVGTSLRAGAGGLRRGRGAPLPPRTAMSIPKAIDQIVEAFIPEMERISEMHESEDQKERHYKAWLRATLQKFADDVRDIESRNNAEDTGKNGAP
jgi:hypothetical protein